MLRRRISSGVLCPAGIYRRRVRFRRRGRTPPDRRRADLCASLQTTIVEILLDKLVRASRDTGIRDIAIAGGVSANSGLRNAVAEQGRRRGWRTFIPEFKFTTDNAAMIAMAGYFRYREGLISPLDTAPVARIGQMEGPR